MMKCPKCGKDKFSIESSKRSTILNEEAIHNHIGDYYYITIICQCGYSLEVDLGSD